MTQFRKVFAVKSLITHLISLLAYLPYPCFGQHTKKDVIVLGSYGHSTYQIVLSEQKSPAVNQAALLVKEAFKANGFNIPITTEGEKDERSPGIYIGDTKFARRNDIELTQFKGWSYAHKVVGTDLIIAGTDSNGRLGIVKGVCDFLREYVNTRFLYPGMTGIEFIKTPTICVPRTLDTIREPWLQFNFGFPFDGVDFYSIANNQFPNSGAYVGHTWPLAIPLGRFRSHPEYSALVRGRRAFEDDKLPLQAREQYCISNPDVQELIFQYLARTYDQGSEYVSSAQSDGFRTCECEHCRDLYGTIDWGEKIWILQCKLAERLKVARPGMKIVMLSYTLTTHPPKTFRTFPDNAIVLLTHHDSATSSEWNGYKAQVAAWLYNWENYNMVGYLPKKTPSYEERQVKSLTKLKVCGVYKGGFGSCIGLEGPTYYVFGRMFDDPQGNNADDLVEEFYTAAFGEVAGPMRRFFSTLHNGLELHAEYLTPRAQAQRYLPVNGRRSSDATEPLDWVGKSTSIFGSVGLRRYIEDPKQMLRLVYTPELILKLEHELEQAELIADSEKVKARLNLIRAEFNYLKSAVRVICLHDAYNVRPNEASLNRLLAGIDAWNSLLNSYYDSVGIIRSLPDWPELKLFRGERRSDVGFLTTLNWNNERMDDNPFSYDTKAIRSNPNILMNQWRLLGRN